MTEELTRDTVMARRFDLVEQIAIIAARHKAELAPLNEELGLCETFIRDTMNKGNEQSISIKGVGMAYFTTKSKCAVRDFDATLAEIQKHGLWSLLTKAVSKETVKEYIGIHNQPPPGVEYSEYRDLSWKRG